MLLVGSAVAGADEAAIRKAAQAKFPRANVQNVTKLPYLGLYELVVNGEIVYSDENFDYIIYEGNIIDVKNDRNFTEERKRKLAMIPFEDLPLDLAVKRVKGNGERKMAIFTDPDCPFCKRIEGDLAKVDNVTIYMFLFPIDSLHPKADRQSQAHLVLAGPHQGLGRLHAERRRADRSRELRQSRRQAGAVRHFARHQRDADARVRERRPRARRNFGGADREAVVDQQELSIA